MQNKSSWIPSVPAILIVAAAASALSGQTLPGAPSGSAEEILFETPPVIETAALYAQTLKDAPANVTVVTAKDIRRYGFRTLAEVLSNVRGFYFTSDGYLQYAGVRGFGLPGDSNTRILVMINGHYMTDNVYGAMYLFGQDFPIDMELVQRIEVVRGPSSALYGSNGIFATINIFTKGPVDAPPVTLSTEAGSFGEKKAHISSSTYLGHGANLLLSLSGFHSTGRSITALTSSSLAGGTTDKVGAEQGYHSFAHLTFRNWSFLANFSDRRMITPIGLFGTDFGDPGTAVRNAHNFVEAAWSDEIGKASTIRLRFSYDQFRYFGNFDYTMPDAIVALRDEAFGDWLGTQLVFRTNLSRFGALTLGGQANADIRNRQKSYPVQTYDYTNRDTSARDASAGVFAQQEWNFSPKLTGYLGLRLDDSKRQSAFLSPRVAAVYKPTALTSYKLMYGHAFRNPSTYERYWEPNPALEAERMNTYEFTAERTLAKNIELVGSVFHYRLDGLIEGVAISDMILQYRNVSASRSTGAEAEVQGKIADWLQVSAAVTAQRTRYASPSRALPNSPSRMANFRAALPLLGERLNFSSAIRYLSSRLTAYGSPLPGVALVDFTATTNRLHPDFDLQFGIRNLANKQYADPLSVEHLPTVLQRAGRSVFVRLLWQRKG